MGRKKKVQAKPVELVKVNSYIMWHESPPLQTMGHTGKVVGFYPGGYRVEPTGGGGNRRIDRANVDGYWEPGIRKHSHGRMKQLA